MTKTMIERMSDTHFFDHVSMVHSALGSIRDLVMANDGDGKNPDGSEECLDVVSRTGFVDLLEIIHDRLGMALEMALEKENAK